MLQQIRLHNFKTYLDAKIDLTRRHLLIGRNNSGKTNLCAALIFLKASAKFDLPQAIGVVPGGIPELRNWLHAGELVEIGITCELPFGDQELTYKYELTLQVAADASGFNAPGALNLRLVKEKLILNGGGHRETPLIQSNGRQVTLLDEEAVDGQSASTTITAPSGATMLSKLFETEKNRRALLFRRYLANWYFFSLSPQHIRDGYRVGGEPTGMKWRGDDLAKTIFYLKAQDDRRYNRFLDRVRLFEPSLESVSFLVAPDQGGAVAYVSLKHREAASWVGLSNGTLLAMGLSLIIELIDRESRLPGAIPPLVMIEEPENGIYGGLLRKLLEDFDNYAGQAQYIFTTHSPFVMDMFAGEPESVTLLRREQERTIVQRLEREKEIPPLEERFSLSDKYFAELLP